MKFRKINVVVFSFLIFVSFINRSEAKYQEKTGKIYLINDFSESQGWRGGNSSSGRGDNRWIVSKNFEVNYRNPNTCFGSNSPSLMVSFLLKNISDSGISIFFTWNQAKHFQVNHVAGSGCDGDPDAGGIPIFSERYNETSAKRDAVYIPRNGERYITLTKTWCDCSKIPTGKIFGGIVSGNIHLIKGNRIVTRSFSGRF